MFCLGCGARDFALCPGCGPSAAQRLTETVAGVRITAAGSYDGVLRRAIVAMKTGERAYLDPFAELLVPCVAAGVALVPLPTGRGRRAARGFDQALELARRLSRITGAQCFEPLVKRGAAQRGLDRRARLAFGGRFTCRPQASLPDAAIVIDDVWTTGATLTDGIAALRAAGVAVLGGAVIARTSPGRNFAR